MKVFGSSNSSNGKSGDNGNSQDKSDPAGNSGNSGNNSVKDSSNGNGNSSGKADNGQGNSGQAKDNGNGNGNGNANGSNGQANDKANNGKDNSNKGKYSSTDNGSSSSSNGKHNGWDKNKDKGSKLKSNNGLHLGWYKRGDHPKNPANSQTASDASYQITNYINDISLQNAQVIETSNKDEVYDRAYTNGLERISEDNLTMTDDMKYDPLYYVNDGKGNVTELTDGRGVTRDRYRYDPYSQLLITVSMEHFL